MVFLIGDIREVWIYFEILKSVLFVMWWGEPVLCDFKKLLWYGILRVFKHYLWEFTLTYDASSWFCTLI